MVPLLAMLVSGSLTIVGRPLLSGFVAAFFTANWMVVQLAAQGILSFPWGSSAWLRTPEIDLQSMQRLTHAVHASCDKERAGHLSIIGADLPDFNAASAWFYAEKMQGEVGYRCNYNNLGYAAKDLPSRGDTCEGFQAQFRSPVRTKTSPGVIDRPTGIEHHLLSACWASC
jgi:hypothetical protein